MLEVDKLLKEFKLGFEIKEKKKEGGGGCGGGGGGTTSSSKGELWSEEALEKLEAAISTGQSLQSCVKELLQKDLQQSSVAMGLKDQLSNMQGQLLNAVQQLQSTELQAESSSITMAEGKVHLAEFCKVMRAWKQYQTFLTKRPTYMHNTPTRDSDIWKDMTLEHSFQLLVKVSCVSGFDKLGE